MEYALQELLRPEILNTVRGLELAARIISEGFMAGSTKSQSVGAGQVFSQYRNYETGDDLRQLDWKMFARSERYFIKQADIETNITVKFVLDASRSMLHEEHGITKFQYAKLLIAALGWLAVRQGDTIGFYATNETALTALPPRFEQQQFMRFITALAAVKAEKGFGNVRNTSQLYDRHGKELIFVFTDLYDTNRDVQEFVTKLKTSRNETAVLHLIGRAEKNLDYPGIRTFEDLETGERIEVSTAAQQYEYADRVSSWLAQSRDLLLEKHIGYHRVTIGDPPEHVLRDFLLIRKKLIR